MYIIEYERSVCAHMVHRTDAAGREPDSKQLQSMIGECPHDLNFTHFLTLFGEKMAGETSSAWTLRSNLHPPISHTSVVPSNIPTLSFQFIG